MMLLLDIGNTRIKWGWLAPAGGLRPGGAVVHGGRHQSVLQAWAKLPKPQRIFGASVAGCEFNREVEQVAQTLWNLPVHWARSSEGAAAMKTAYAEPGQLGVDRWAAAVGAYYASGRAVCVVDCGSAITFDVVTDAGRHLGGLIVPGWQMMRRALHQGTAGLPLVELEQAETIARDTATAIASGTLLGAAAMIDGLTKRIMDALGTTAELWLTGGDAPLLQPHLQHSFILAPDLVLQGLAVMASSARTVPELVVKQGRLF